MQNPLACSLVGTRARDGGLTSRVRYCRVHGDGTGLDWTGEREADKALLPSLCMCVMRERERTKNVCECVN